MKATPVNAMHNDIIKFISGHHVAALSIADGDSTWSSCCFYAFHKDDPALIFLSHGDTLHAQLMLESPKISGTISAQTKSVLQIKGVQFKGEAKIIDNPKMRAIYNKRFPFARVVDATLWVVRLDMVKYTSNTIKFGKKLHWERE